MCDCVGKRYDIYIYLRGHFGSRFACFEKPNRIELVGCFEMYTSAAMTFSLGDGAVPSRLYGMRTQRFRTIETIGDGACAIHSVFGTSSPGGLCLQNARGFLAATLGDSAVVLRARANDDALVDEVAFVLWADIVKPQAKAYAGLPVGAHALSPEARVIWEEIKKVPAVLRECVEKVRQDHDMYERFEQKRSQIAQAFAPLCTRSLEHVFLRPLLLSIGLLESYCNTAWSVDDFPHVVTKFDALFVNCDDGNRFRRSIVESLGVSNFHVLAEKVQDVVGTMDWRQEAAPVFEFCDMVTAAQEFDTSAAHVAFPDFLS